MKINIPTLLTGGLVGITTCTGLALSSVTTFADNDSSTDEVNITVPVACTMTGTIASGQEHTATLQPGTYSGASGSAYENGIGKTTLATYCNDYNGFSIYAIGFTGETEGDNTLVGTSASGGATIPTKVYESTDTTSNWSMKVTKVTDTSITFNPANMSITNSFDSWHTVPDDYTKVAEYHASTGSSATDQSLGAKVETTYASYISTSQPADTYTGKVKYVMVHPYDHAAPTPPTVSFDDAYAAAGKTKLNNHYKMQDMTSSICESITLGQEGQLIDMRDNKIYYVAKLPDERCWMTQNLDHNIDSSYNYNSTNTDVPANWSDTLTSTYATGTTTWNYSTATPESYDPGDRCWNGTLDPDYSTDLDTGTTACSSITTTPDHYHIGNYYNWTASVAMQDSGSYGADNTDVNQSICPAGWMLPKKTGSGSFYDLVNGRYTAGTSGNIQSSPVYFVYGGSWHGSSYNVGSCGLYLSSVVRDPYGMYYLYFDVDGYLYPQYGSERDGSGLIRCLAR